MKYLITLLVFIIHSQSYAQMDCSADIHPKVKAECLLKELVASGADASVAHLVKAYEKSGLSASGEVGSTFVGGSCANGGCTWKYIVSTDYSNSDTFKSIVLSVQATTGKGAPVLVKGLGPADL